jgi:uncharacterized membrane protein HdeD (DUF308 family)
MDGADARFNSSYWWVLTLRGILAILFGVAAVFWPGLTLTTLVYLFSTYVLVTGIIGIVHGMNAIGNRTSWLLTLLLGFVEVGVGVYLLRHVDVAFNTLVLLIGFTLIVRGVLEAVAAFNDEVPGTGRSMLLIAGLLSLVVGIVVLFQKEAAGVAFVWLLGLYAIIVGAVLVALSTSVRAMLEGGAVRRTARR